MKKLGEPISGRAAPWLVRGGLEQEHEVEKVRFTLKNGGVQECLAKPLEPWSRKHGE